jgi:hypothetical protein
MHVHIHAVYYKIKKPSIKLGFCFTYTLTIHSRKILADFVIIE